MNTKTIILGVSGGIACYKSCELARLLVKQGHNVHVIMTKAATQFVQPLTFEVLSKNAVLSDLFDAPIESRINHIDLADKADAIIVAPATADLLARAAGGLADDLLTTTLLATKAKIFVAPSMNVNMWEHPLTQNNLKKLVDIGYNIIPPGEGELACGWTGAGRMAEPEEIVKTCLRVLGS